jgi:hypothetical protein
LKKINILYITYDGLTDPLGQSQILPYLTKIANKNIYVDILSFEKKITFLSTTKKVKDKISSSNIKWIPLFYIKNPPIFSTLVDLIKAHVSSKKLFKNSSYDIVHCRGYIPSIIGLHMKKKYNVKLIFDMRGWWPDEKKESGHWDNKIFKVIYNYFKKKEIQLFSNSDKIISLTTAGKIEITKNNWSTSDKIGVIPTCVDFDNFPLFNEETRDQTRKKLNIKLNAKVLVYSGSMGGNYDIKEFSLIFKSFINLSLSNRILIVSKTPKEFILNKLTANKLDTSRVIIIESEFSNVYKYLQASDLGLILYKKAFSTLGRSPTKLGEYWASGIPALSLKGIGDLDFINKKYPFGLELLEDFNNIDLQKPLQKIFSKSNIENLRNAAKEYYHIDKGINFYSNIYEELTK